MVDMFGFRDLLKARVADVFAEHRRVNDPWVTVTGKHPAP
jgi:hypothetical protein